MTKELGEFLVANRLVKEEQLQQARLMQQETGTPLARALVALGHLSENDLLQHEAARLGIPYTDLSDYRVNPKAIFVVPAHIVERWRVLPLQWNGRVLVVATSDPLNVLAEDDLRLYTGLQVQWVVAPPEQIEAGIARADEETKDMFV